jgi:thiosulfate reductase cytochrome b subunit
MHKNQDTVLLHPLVVRLTHWAWALGVLVLIGSGLRIYESDPVFESVAFPVWITLGGSYEDTNKLHNDFGLAAALLLHFAAMWLLFASLPVFLLWAWLSGHFRRRYLPVTAREVVGNVTDFLRWRLPHDIGMRNAVQNCCRPCARRHGRHGALWAGAVEAGRFRTLSLLMGQYEGARYVHFFGIAGIVRFVIVHVALTLLVPKVLPPMITGRAAHPERPLRQETRHEWEDQRRARALAATAVLARATSSPGAAAVPAQRPEPRRAHPAVGLRRCHQQRPHGPFPARHL